MNTLSAQTLVYWNLSRKWNGQDGNGIAPSSAFKAIANTLKHTGPRRPLAKALKNLRKEIIYTTQPTDNALFA